MKNMIKRKCYIARYPLNAARNDLDEIILIEDTYYSPRINAEWDRLVVERDRSDPMLQCWYSDADQVSCMAQTNQPFQLD